MNNNNKKRKVKKKLYYNIHYIIKVRNQFRLNPNITYNIR